QGRPDPGVAPSPFELGRDHAGVVEYQHVARAQEAGQVAHAAILERPLAAHHQHARRVARAGRPQGDAFGRKIEVEQVYAHGARLAAERPACKRRRAQSPSGTKRCSLLSMITRPAWGAAKWAGSI